MIQELRRGHEHVIQFSQTFDFEDNWLACISDSGTVHIFHIDNKKQQDAQIKPYQDSRNKNPKSQLNFLGFISPYFKNEFSFSNYKVDFEAKTKLGFQQDGTQLLQSYLGEMISLDFDKVSGGICKKIFYLKNFMTHGEAGVMDSKNM